MAPLTRARAHLVAVLASLASFLVLGPASAALASWSAQGSGGAASAATVMPTGAQPVAGAAGSSVTVSWSASTFPGGPPVGGYVVKRFNAVTAVQSPVGSGCSGVVTATTCTENAVPSGAWVYTDTPVQLNWTGGASPDSTPVVVP